MQALSRAVLSAVFLAATLATQQAHADLSWNWSYTGAGIEAGGTLITAEAADAQGFHQITGITGQRNGQAITALYPTGSAIPGNEPYALDNLIRVNGTGQITVHGFGYAIEGGGHANPFYADFLATPGYLEVFTTPTGFSEVPITFTAAPVPEPDAAALLMVGLGTLLMARSRYRAD